MFLDYFFLREPSASQGPPFYLCPFAGWAESSPPLHHREAEELRQAGRGGRGEDLGAAVSSAVPNLKDVVGTWAQKARVQAWAISEMEGGLSVLSCHREPVTLFSLHLPFWAVWVPPSCIQTEWSMLCSALTLSATSPGHCIPASQQSRGRCSDAERELDTWRIKLMGQQLERGYFVLVFQRKAVFIPADGKASPLGSPILCKGL